MSLFNPVTKTERITSLWFVHPGFRTGASLRARRALWLQFVLTGVVCSYAQARVRQLKRSHVERNITAPEPKDLELIDFVSDFNFVGTIQIPEVPELRITYPSAN